MDIDLFSEMVKNLILDNDEVTLPGLGTFVSEVMPSVFSDKGYTINPPYRKLSFRQRVTGNESMLADFYARTNGMDSETSKRILDEFIIGLRGTLQTKKIIVFPGLGRLRATKENAFFFIADEDLDIYPYGIGLEPVSLKTHEETPDEVTRSVEALRELVYDPVATTEPAAEPVVQQSSPSIDVVAGTEEVVPQTDGAEVLHNLHKKKKRGLRTMIIIVACVVCIAALALGVFILLAHVAPDFIDSILYNSDELRIINY